MALVRRIDWAPVRAKGGKGRGTLTQGVGLKIYGVCAVYGCVGRGACHINWVKD